MFKIEWDRETGGVLLSSKVTKNTLGISPRPVFYEELDLVGLDNLGFTYPKVQEPIMWALNKQYWYRGQMLFEVKGANLYDAPTISLAEGVSASELMPVDVVSMLDKNSDAMFLIESEAIEFIRDIYVTYARVNKAFNNSDSNKLDFEALAQKLEQKTKKKMAVVRQDCDSFDIMPLEQASDEGKKVLLSTKVDNFIASFSGGKDSQVVLDLCTRAIPPTDFEVIYSDTGYELPPSLQLYEHVQEYYKPRFPDLQFSTTRNHRSVLAYWDMIGTPSDAHRWCCKIMKTAPLYRSLKVDGNKQARVLAFEGVRAEESARRNEYGRIGKGVKHSTTINARPIFYWNTTEIFLYLMRYSLPINMAYRLGKARVGCIICPFSSSWDDMIVNRCYHESLSPFLSRLTSGAKKQGVKDIDDYLKARNWKFRASGNALKNKTQIFFSPEKHNFRAKVINPTKDLFSWLGIIGNYHVQHASDEKILGELRYKDSVFSFEFHKDPKNNAFEFTVFDASDVRLITLLRRIIYKTAYCINCEACEVECPSGALSVYPQITVDATKCVHCYKCLEFHDKGCIVANSLDMTNGTNLKSKTGIDRYSTFGLHEEWLVEFLSDPDNYWENISLGKKQVSSMKSWLKEAEIVDSNLKITPTGTALVQIYQNNPTLAWEIVAINLAYNSFIVNWVLNSIGVNGLYDNSLIDDTIKLQYGDAYGAKTIQNARAAFMQLMKYSPIGETLMAGVENGKKRQRQEYSALSPEAVAYSIYKFAEARGITYLRVSDFYRPEENNGIFHEFGLSKPNLLKKLRFLSTAKDRLLVAELNMGLEHITLREDLNALKVLQSFV